MKYYMINVKCGHVGKNSYLLKWIYLEAESKKEAAAKARITPRVKHDHKDAIREVIEINLEQYIEGLNEMRNDLYFKVKNSSQQRKEHVLEGCTIYREVVEKKYKKERNGQRLRLSEMIREARKMINGGYCYE